MRRRVEARGFLGTPASRAPSDFFDGATMGRTRTQTRRESECRLSEIGVGLHARKYIIPDSDEAIAMSYRMVRCSKLQQYVAVTHDA